jgi:ABC-type branched-subunit amino acid transport system substrate-binding protein
MSGYRNAKAAMAALMLGSLLLASPVLAEPRYDPGADDSEIRIGQTMPYSGPASAFSLVGKVQAAYFRMINEQGGVNGRRINLISYDDGLNAAKTVEQVRRLVESDDVLFIFQTLGTSANSAIQPYLNTREIPQLFVSARALRFEDPKTAPWTLPFAPSTWTEAALYGRFIARNHPDARVGVLYENDDGGRDAVAGLRAGLAVGTNARIVQEASYESTDPTVTTQIITLQSAGADVLLNMASPKFAIQAIRKAAELGWRPEHFLGIAAASIGIVLQPAGIENSTGIISASSFKEVTDPTWREDPGMLRWAAFMDKYYPEGERNSVLTTYGYSSAELLVKVLQLCGDDLTRENVMRQATHLQKVELDLLLPGITVDTSPDDYRPIEQFQMMRFTGERWDRFGAIQ